MMMQVWRWWWQNHHVGDFFSTFNEKTVIIISSRSRTAQTCHRHKLYLTLVPSIFVTTNLFDSRFKKKRDYVRSNSKLEWLFHPLVLKNVLFLEIIHFSDISSIIRYISDQIFKTSDDKNMIITSGHWCKSSTRIRKRCSLSWSSKYFSHLVIMWRSLFERTLSSCLILWAIIEL